MSQSNDPLEVQLDPDFKKDMDGHYKRVKSREGEVEAGDLVVSVRKVLEDVTNSNPYLGDPFEHGLAGLRRIKVDHSKRMDRPRFRFVYELLPNEGAPGIVYVWGLVPRGEGVGYTQIHARRRPGQETN